MNHLLNQIYIQIFGSFFSSLHIYEMFFLKFPLICRVSSQLHWPSAQQTRASFLSTRTCGRFPFFAFWDLNAWTYIFFPVLCLMKTYSYEEHRGIQGIPATLQLPFVLLCDDQFLLVFWPNVWEAAALTILTVANQLCLPCSMRFLLTSHPALWLINCNL